MNHHFLGYIDPADKKFYFLPGQADLKDKFIAFHSKPNEKVFASVYFQVVKDLRTRAQNGGYRLRNKQLADHFGNSTKKMHEITMQRAGFGEWKITAGIENFDAVSSATLSKKEWQALFDEQDKIVMEENEDRDPMEWVRISDMPVREKFKKGSK